MIDTRTGLFD